MGYLLLPLLCAGGLPGSEAAGSFLSRPVSHTDEPPCGPWAAYEPQPGDIFLATDQERWARAGHWVAGGAGVHHSGIVFRRSDGRMAILEAGPFNSVRVEAMDPYEHMGKHVAAGDHVWVRRRAMPLTPEQCSRLTEFAEAQVGKPFAVLRLAAQVTPFRGRGPLRSWVVGKPHGDRRSWFCSELVVECCVYAGLMDAETARPVSTYPRDLFYGKSFNWYLNTHLCLDAWEPPARWAPCAPPR